jgi:hypothetical protein
MNYGELTEKEKQIIWPWWGGAFEKQPTLRMPSLNNLGNKRLLGNLPECTDEPTGNHIQEWR